MEFRYTHTLVGPGTRPRNTSACCTSCSEVCGSGGAAWTAKSGVFGDLKVIFGGCASSVAIIRGVIGANAVKFGRDAALGEGRVSCKDGRNRLSNFKMAAAQSLSRNCLHD